MIEYEYSFETDNLKKYIAFAQVNNFIKVSENRQIRTLYKNGGEVMARITEDIVDDKTIISLDIKDDFIVKDAARSKRESRTVIFDSKDAMEDVLNMLGYKKDKELIRNRINYKKDNVCFEFDDYISPNKTCVVAIEGEKIKVDEIVEKIKKI